MRRKPVATKKQTLYFSYVLTICLCALVVLTAGCQTDAQTGGLAGAGLGALAGQAIGGDTKSTLIGAGIGAGVGYIIGNEKDKKATQNYNPNTPTTLSGTKWKVISLVPEKKPGYESLVVEFRSDGIVVTTRFEPGGTKTITEEHYRIVGNTLIVNKTDYLINAEYKIDGQLLIVDCEHFRAVLQRM